MQPHPQKEGATLRSRGLPQALDVLIGHAAISNDVSTGSRRELYKMLIFAGSVGDGRVHSGFISMVIQDRLDAKELLDACTNAFARASPVLDDALMHKVATALETGAIDADSPGEGGVLMLGACVASNSEVIAEVVKNFQRPPPQDILVRALCYAISHQPHPNGVIIDILLRAGVDAGGVGDRGETPLHVAARLPPSSWCTWWVNVLRQHWSATHATVRSDDVRGTPLHEARSPGAVSCLVHQLKADTEARNSLGETPLLTMAKTSSATSTTMISLMRAGACVDVRDNENASPLHRITMRRWERISPFLNVAREMLSRLDPAGRERLLAPKGGSGWTPLHEVRSPDVATFFLGSGADVNAIDPKTGYTPLASVVARHSVPMRERTMTMGTVLKIISVFVDAGARCDDVQSFMKLAALSPSLLGLIPLLLKK